MMAETVEQFLNPTKIVEDLVSRLKSLAIPGVDVDAVMAAQRKNIEALANANRSALDGAHAVGKRQAEILQETMSQTAQSLKTLAKAGSPFDIAAKQAELTKEGFAKALGNMRELAEMVSKAQHGAVEAISDRVAQSMNELRHAVPKPTGSPTMKPQPATAAASTNH
jgi:phasin family protein